MGLVASAVAAVVLLAGCGAEPEVASDGKGAAKASAAAPAVKKSAPAKVRIVSSGFEDHEVWGPHSYVVRWELTNTGESAGDFFAGLDFLDADGDVLGSTGITANKVGPGKTAKGDTAPLPVEIDKGSVKDIKGVKVSEVERVEV
jgi:hypothetical protein